MPPHRPKYQPENHRSSMLLSSDSAPITVKVVRLNLPNPRLFTHQRNLTYHLIIKQCRHCLNRPFNLKIVSGSSDVTVYVPSNFNGFISYSHNSKATTSALFADQVLPNVYFNELVPRSWRGDQIMVSTSGNVTFRVWDVFTGLPEKKKESWRKVFSRVGERRTPSPSPTTPTWDWDFLLDDDE